MENHSEEIELTAKGNPILHFWDDLSMCSVLENRETCYTADRMFKNP